VNPTFVGVDAVGAAGVSRTRSGKGLVTTDVFRVSGNLDAGSRQTRLARRAAGSDAKALVPTDDVAALAPTDATDGIGRQAATLTKRRRVGLSARKRKQA
jgi:hypothetical protein